MRNSLLKKGLTPLALLGKEIINLLSKRDFIIIAFFTILGMGGVFAAGLVTISAPNSQGAGYLRATACDENVTIRALTAPDAATGQLYVATIALSAISQSATTGCGNKTMQIALKINNQMRYATWDILEASTDSTFYLTGATSSISDYYADTVLSPFQADGLTNVAIAKIGSFTNTETWTERADPGSRWWSSITSSSDGTKLAAVVWGGSLYTSTNSGVTWTNRSVGGWGWESITSSSDGTKLAKVAYGGNIWTSSNSGVTWTARPTAGSRGWYSITSSADGTKLAAGAYGGNIWTSTDSGVTWTERITSDNPNWKSITSSADGTKLAAVAYNGYIYTSSDSGLTWTAKLMESRRWESITSSSDGTKLAAAIASGTIWTSTDSGVTWTERTNAGGGVTGESLSKNWNSITSSSDGTKLAAGATNDYIFTSSNSGVTWTARTAPGSRWWTAITSSSDGTKLVTAANNDSIYTGVKSFSRSSN